MSDLGQLRQLLVAYFSESELMTLTFDLGMDYEMLPGSTKGDKARELVAYLWRRGRLADLTSVGRELRPQVAWPDVAQIASPETTETAAKMPDSDGVAAPAMTSANPFTYGNPISDPDRFFGRSREIEQVFNRLRNAEAESSSIVGGRRIGKSSLLNYLAHPDIRRRHGMDPERSIFVYVDLQMVDEQTTPARLWQGLLSRMARQSRDESLNARLREIISAGEFDNFTLADLFDAVDSSTRHVVFLLDEFETVTSNPNFDPGFFYGLRSLAIQHNLSLVTSSRHELIELTHSQAVRSSPFFNIFANINLRLFNETESGRLLHGLLDETGVEFTEEELAALADIAGGHPFFLQAAGHFLFSAHAAHADATRRRAAWLKAFSTEVGPHLAHFWRTTDPPGQISLLLLALLSRQAGGRPFIEPDRIESLYPRAGQSLGRLARLGYVAEDAGRFAIFSTAFSDWIVAEMRTGGQIAPPTAPEAATGQALARMPTGRQAAMGTLLNRVAAGYQPLLVELVAQSGDPEQTLQLLLERLV